MLLSVRVPRDDGPELLEVLGHASKLLLDSDLPKPLNQVPSIIDENPYMIQGTFLK